MKTFTSAVTIIVSGLLLAGPACAQTGAGAPSEQGGSTKQDANHKARGRADAGQAGQGERDSSGKDASTPGSTKQVLMQVQQALKDKGQDPGPVDGVMGAKTQAALKAYQKEQGLEATGRLDAKTTASLGVEAPPTR